jgi:hypothetical protein
VVNSKTDSELSDDLAADKAVEAAVREAVREAMLQHKRAGNTVVGWRDGQVEWVPPEKIAVDDDGQSLSH